MAVPRRIFPTWADDRSKKFVFRPLILPYLALPLWLGLGYTLGDPARTATPSFEQAKLLTSIEHWGWMFLAGAAVIAATMWMADTLYLRIALFIGAFIYTWWGVLFFIGTLNIPNSSVNAAALYWFIAFAHFVAAGLPQRARL